MPLSGMTCTARMLMPSTSSFALVATRNLISTRTSRSGTITWSASPADKVVDVHGKVIRGAVRVLGKLEIALVIIRKCFIILLLRSPPPPRRKAVAVQPVDIDLDKHCVFCCKEMDSSSQMDDHVRQRHLETAFVCRLCDTGNHHYEADLPAIKDHLKEGMYFIFKMKHFVHRSLFYRSRKRRLGQRGSQRLHSLPEGSYLHQVQHVQPFVSCTARGGFGTAFQDLSRGL